MKTELIRKYNEVNKGLEYLGENEVLEKELKYLETKLMLQDYDFTNENKEKYEFESYRYFNSDDSYDGEVDFNY